MRNVLLLEPNYQNKYPPIGLMKIAKYHRRIGDRVVFYKGDLNTFIIKEICEDVIRKLYHIDKHVSWETFRSDIASLIKHGHKEHVSHISEASVFSPLVRDILLAGRSYYYNKQYFKDKKWDRVCVTTLFTFHWKSTIETIEFAKQVCNKPSEVWVGGVLASVVPDQVERATGIKPYVGLLDRPGILDEGNDLIIDEMPLDYSILDEIDYKYPESNAYYGYMTRGCIRKCEFCAVPKLEPKFVPFITLNAKLERIAELYGEQRNLLLLDNNVLASPRFAEIIQEIKDNGFVNGAATYIEPNWLDIAVRNLQKGLNDTAYVKKAFRLMKWLLDRLQGDNQEFVYNLLSDNHLLHEESANKAAVLAVYPEVAELFEKHRSKVPKKRYVDFNQGVDARLITEEKMKLLAEIPIRPLRIAFDHWSDQDVYERAVRLAAKHGITHLSNYLLYNYKDEPIELYRRLRMNVMLCQELDINIYSFPMKYHPIDDPDYFQNRDYIGEHWNKKFIRAVQSVLNSTKGKIGTSLSFFEAAFGMDEEDFRRILYMPEEMIIHRYKYIKNGMAEKWWQAFQQIEYDAEILQAIHSNWSKILINVKPDVVRHPIAQYYMR